MLICSRCIARWTLGLIYGWLAGVSAVSADENVARWEAQVIDGYGYYYQNVRDDVEVVLGAVATEVELATKGYVLIKR